MNDINEQRIVSLNTAFRTFCRRSVREKLKQADIISNCILPKHRGIHMDRRKMTQLKEQYAILQKENVIREVAAIVKSKGGDQKEPVSEKRLRSYVQTDPQGVEEAIGKLEREGYLTRSKSRTDRKETFLSLTEKGWQRAAELKKIKDRQNEEFLKPLSEEEKATLIHLLEKLNVADELGFAR